MHVENLLKLANLLDTNAANPNGVKFDYDYWGHVPRDTEVAMNCGTTACALGLAAISGQFPGLSYVMGRWDPHIKAYWLEITDSEKRIGSPFLYAATVFDIPRGDAKLLFLHMHITKNGAEGERQLAGIIRRYVNGENLSEINTDLKQK